MNNRELKFKVWNGNAHDAKKHEVIKQRRKFTNKNK